MKKYFIIPASLFVLTILTGGCKKYLDINKNPNAANEPPIAGLLANTTNLTAYNVYNVSNSTSYFVQYLASPSVSSTNDTYQQSDPSGTWGGIYNVLTDLYDMRKFGSEKNLLAYAGVSEILTAFNLSMGSNLWGNMPYSQAFVGVNNLVPKYDDQKVIYDSCLMLLDKGIAILQQPALQGQLDAASDFIHGGSDSSWIKTAYAIKARLLNQVSKTSQYDPVQVLAAIDNAYTGSGDDAQITQFAVRNPWAQAAINNQNLLLDAWLSSYFVNATNGTIYGVFDPRLPQITDTTMFHDYRGTPNGAGFQGFKNTDHAQSYLDVGKWYSSTNSPLQLITNAECRFIEAEASFRSGNLSRAYTAYIAGISASMNKLNVPADSIAKYIANPAISVGMTALTLNLIMKDKYVACFLMPVTWDDMRRFDYAYKNFVLPVNVTLPTFIRRLDYPSSEISTNGSNVPNVQRTDHLWWDQ
ncbi:MAG: SusD/RagB family nutrient-binding outer membrane lipoprotein [Bacteroidota bacterium]|nr:SusD/RagB family nutrient-binding outer membrane lipoprotein [Bacteroidota bacterium]